jgi:hypothetical protein
LVQDDAGRRHFWSELENHFPSPAPTDHGDACVDLATCETAGECDAAPADDRQKIPLGDLMTCFLLPPPPPSSASSPQPPDQMPSGGFMGSSEQSELAGFPCMSPSLPASFATKATSSSSPVEPLSAASEGEAEQATTTSGAEVHAGPAVFSHPHFRGSTRNAGQALSNDKRVYELSGIQVVNDSEIMRGMEKAKEPLTMNRDFAAEPSAAASSGMVVSDAKTTPPLAPATEPVVNAPEMRADTDAPAAPLAVSTLRLIERVEQAADQLSTLRSREEFRFNVDVAGQHRVEVKVAVRGGRVFADFRADTPELRDALARGWDTFVRSREGGAQRWADPVFSSHAPSPSSASSVERASGAPADESASGRGSSANDHPSSRREYSEVDDVGLIAGAPAAASRSSAPLLAAPSGGAPRSDGARLLSVLA